MFTFLSGLNKNSRIISSLGLMFYFSGRTALFADKNNHCPGKCTSDRKTAPENRRNPSLTALINKAFAIF
jgi:hypothetical protein